MSNAFFETPLAVNEPVLSYGPGSPEKQELKMAYRDLFNKQINIPMTIGGKKIRTSDRISISPPHDHNHVIGQFSRGTKDHVVKAIDAAMKAKLEWSEMPWQDRAAIFLKAADLLAGPWRYKMNAATMIGQSKNAFQSEIDAVCELVDFFKFNVQYMIDIYSQQPESSQNVWNRMEYRPLEGFVFALTPFNFTSIAANLPASAALMGNTVVWKPAHSQVYSAHFLMELFEAAGLPPGVINLVFVDGPSTGEVIFNHPDFAGLHFTGSTGVFQRLWTTIGNNIGKYKSYPRIVGETGGKDFVMAHPSADPKELSTALIRGAFEFQGQKCSAASRAYIPESLWKKTWAYMEDDLNSITVGDPFDFSNFVNAVIDEKAYTSIKKYIDGAKRNKKVKVIYGGTCNKSVGYFIEPTVILSKDPKSKTMCEEIFGPVLTIFVYKDKDFEKTLKILDETSPYALTGAIFAKDRSVINHMTKQLKNSAGNFYINDKPTGAVVGQQPFGGARASGTNDKAGSYLNLLRWVSPRTIKENFAPATDYRYPFLMEE